MLEIARNPVPPDKSLPLSPTPAIDTQIATVMRDNINFPTRKLFDVETTRKTPKTFEIHDQKQNGNILGISQKKTAVSIFGFIVQTHSSLKKTKKHPEKKASNVHQKIPVVTKNGVVERLC